MNVDTRFSKDNAALTISISGDFNYSLLKEFCNSYNSKEAISAERIIIDLSKTLTIDSSALGMLLNMQKHLNKPDRAINIVNCNQVVKNVFTITNFNIKFKIE